MGVSPKWVKSRRRRRKRKNKKWKKERKSRWKQWPASLPPPPKCINNSYMGCIVHQYHTKFKSPCLIPISHQFPILGITDINPLDIDTYDDIAIMISYQNFTLILLVDHCLNYNSRVRCTTNSDGAAAGRQYYNQTHLLIGHNLKLWRSIRRTAALW